MVRQVALRSFRLLTAVVRGMRVPARRGAAACRTGTPAPHPRSVLGQGVAMRCAEFEGAALLRQAEPPPGCPPCSAAGPDTATLCCAHPGACELCMSWCSRCGG